MTPATVESTWDSPRINIQPGLALRQAGIFHISERITQLTTGEESVWFYPKGKLRAGAWESVVETGKLDWLYAGFRIAELEGGTVELTAEKLERIILPLNGSFAVTYLLDGDSEIRTQLLTGRKSVFHGPSDSLYLPTGTSATISGTGRVSVSEAPTDNYFPVNYMSAEETPVEIRGAGRSTRQVQNFGTPAALNADRFIVCEVITPADNWSSYPPHKHDEDVPGHESKLEEVYYFETAVSRGLEAPENSDPIGYMRNYGSSAGNIDTLEEVRTGDIALVPYGWHGPCMAAPGYDLYYLNVMAGPSEERVWLISDDPSHSWVRQTWDDQQADPRLPYTA